jgi:hypothetical protein
LEREMKEEEMRVERGGDEGRKREKSSNNGSFSYRCHYNRNDIELWKGMVHQKLATSSLESLSLFLLNFPL